MERIVVVVQFDAIAVEAFYVKQAAVQEFELLSRMVCALRETCDECLADESLKQTHQEFLRIFNMCSP